jgi:ribose-phosphate pyrophosphokinase
VLTVVASACAAPLARAVSALLGTGLLELRTRGFSNGQIEVDLPQAALDGDAALFQLFPDRVHDRITELLFALDTLRARGARRVTAVLPYLPYSRSDAPASPGGPVPARLFAALLECAGLDRLITAELHAPQLRGLFRAPVTEIDTSRLIAARLRATRPDGWVVVSPDLGGGKRAERLAAALAAPVAVMRKRRHGEVKESFELLGDVAGRHAVLLDDEINSGETLLSAAPILRRRGAASVTAAATHALFAPGAEERLRAGGLDLLLVTDGTGCATSPGPPIERLSLAPELAAALAGKRPPG